jgi:GT2 family glycosyltransferase
LERQVPVTIVDNSSSRSIASVAKRHGAAYIDAGRNLGFAAGVNIALRTLADEDVDVLLLNPDAVVTPSAVSELSRFLHRAENRSVGAVAPRLIGSDNAEQRLVWPLPTPWRMWAEAFGLGHLPAQHTFVIGAVLLLRREAIDAVGLFDERFFLYAEEADWQRRAGERGWRSGVDSEAIGEHAGAGASTNMRRREALFHASQEAYIRKWYGGAGWSLYRAGACFGAVLRLPVVGGERRNGAARRVVLYWRGPCRCAQQGDE